MVALPNITKGNIRGAIGEGQDGGARGRGNFNCFKCGVEGHYANQCLENQKVLMRDTSMQLNV